MPTSEMLVYGDAKICPRCKPEYAQRLREGVAQRYDGQGASDPWLKIPLFSKVMIIIDLVFCILRGPLLLLGLLGAVMLKKQGNSEILGTVVFEIGSGAGIFIFGLAANIMMLLKKKIGVWFAAVNILATVISIGVGIWQASINVSNMTSGSVELVGGIIGGIIAVLIRIAIFVLYCYAVFTFQRWCTQREATPGRPLA
jgi:hypothetical protein